MIFEKWAVESGVRLDYSQDWGIFPFQIVSIMEAFKKFTSRLGGGFGYKIPDLFTEDAELLSLSKHSSNRQSNFSS